MNNLQKTENGNFNYPIFLINNGDKRDLKFCLQATERTLPENQYRGNSYKRIQEDDTFPGEQKTITTVQLQSEEVTGLRRSQLNHLFSNVYEQFEKCHEQSYLHPSNYHGIHKSKDHERITILHQKEKNYTDNYLITKYSIQINITAHKMFSEESVPKNNLHVRSYPQLLEVAKKTYQHICKNITWVLPLQWNNALPIENIKLQGLYIVYEQMLEEIAKQTKFSANLIDNYLTTAKYIQQFHMAHPQHIAKAVFAKLWEQNHHFRFSYCKVDYPCEKCRASFHTIVIMNFAEQGHSMSRFHRDAIVIDPCKEVVESYNEYALRLKSEKKELTRVVSHISNLFLHDEFDKSCLDVVEGDSIFKYIKSLFTQKLKNFHESTKLEEKKQIAEFLINEIDTTCKSMRSQFKILLNTLRLQLVLFLSRNGYPGY